MKRTKPPINKKQILKNNEKHNHEKGNRNGGNGISNGVSLTARQRAFVQEYLATSDLNGTEAYMKAYNTKNRNSAAVGAHTLLKMPKIQEAIQEEMKKRQERTQVTPDKVVRELAKLAFSNMRSFVEWGPEEVKLIGSDQISDDDTACVVEITQTENSAGKTIKFKLHDKKAALELLGRHLGMFSDVIKNVHIGEEGSPIFHKFAFSDVSIKDAFDKLYGNKEDKK